MISNSMIDKSAKLKDGVLDSQGTVTRAHLVQSFEVVAASGVEHINMDGNN